MDVCHEWLGIPPVPRTNIPPPSDQDTHGNTDRAFLMNKLVSK
jgi:hypothetical protein